MRTLCFLTLLVLLNVGDSLKCHLISYGSLADTTAITTSTSLQECPIGANSCVKTIDYSRNVFSKQCQIGNCTTSAGISQAPANCFNSSNNGAIYSTCCCYGDGCNSAPMSAPALISAFLVGIFAFYVLSKAVEEENFENLPRYEQRNDYKAFITSSYFYEKSESLGDNALALVISMTGSETRKGWLSLEQWDFLNVPIITVRAKNETNSIVVRTKFSRITPHEQCEITSIFASFNLLPNITSISMVGDYGTVDIPFQIPSMEKHNVVICINPMFLGEQWQNFIFISHLYRKFEGFINLYYISAIESVYYLMKEYEKEGYLTIQPWVSVKFRDVPQDVIDSYQEIEYVNQASANTDCLLKYKETSKFITFLDLNDIIIPTRLPTFYQEFQSAVWSWKNVVYLYYVRQVHEALTVRDSKMYSFSKMFRSLNMTDDGVSFDYKIVINPRNANYTWIYGPAIIPEGFSRVKDSRKPIINLRIKWLPHPKDDIQKRQYDSSLDNYISTDDLINIDSEVKRILEKPSLSKILPNLPNYHYFEDKLSQCYFNRTKIGYKKCFGPQLCQIKQRKSVNCIRVSADYAKTPIMKPISYYYAINPKFVLEDGCHPH